MFQLQRKEKREKAKKRLEKLKKKNSNISQIIIEGRTITSKWWGKDWNKNLENYADFSNRIGRNRSYLRNGAVLDLKIKKGKNEALVQAVDLKHIVL